MKRLVDLVISISALVLLSPILLVTTALIFLFEGRPIFFRQKRIGHKGKIFEILKFRTMGTNENLPEEKRISFLGKFLRKSSIDELPEVLNVLKGEMSIVGPRPLLVEYLPFYSKNQLKRHDMLPGITGLAQIKGRNNISWRQKFKYDVFYVKKNSVFFDLQIIFKTFFKVLKSEGVNQKKSISMARFDKEIFIIGAGGHSKVVASCIESQGFKIAGYFDDKAKRDNIIGKISDLKKYENDQTKQFIIAIGNNSIRKKIAESYDLNYTSFIHKTAIVDPLSKIKKGVVVLAGAYLGPDTTIEDHVIINNKSIVEHDSKVKSFSHLAPGTILGGNVQVGESCFIGLGSKIIPSISLSDDIIVGAGGVVTKSLKVSGTYVGTPVRILNAYKEVA